jgi:hypothetical protein
MQRGQGAPGHSDGDLMLGAAIANVTEVVSARTDAWDRETTSAPTEEGLRSYADWEPVS